MNETHLWNVVHKIGRLTNCEERAVGCIIYDKVNDVIVGKGFNKHLDDRCDCETTKTAIHAEIYAINSMTQDYNKDDLVAYINHKPCVNCKSALDKVVSEIKFKDQKENEC